MKTIPLSKAFVTVVDDEDFDLLNQFSWFVNLKRRTQYAQTNSRLVLGKRHGILMHRLIMAAKTGEDVDHVDGDGLNNQRCNLRLCTRSQNLQNMRPFRTRTGFKGVRMVNMSCRLSKPFRAEITINGKNIYLGYYDSATAAAEAYNLAAISLFGEFAKLNEIKRYV